MKHPNGSLEQKRENGPGRLVLLFLIIILLLIAALCSPVSQRLTVAKDGRVLLALPIETGERFSICYLHSANRSPVEDVIEWTGTEFMVRETIYKTFGAGIPIPADGIGTELIKTNEGYVLQNINKPMESFLLMTQSVPDHRLVHQNASYRLIDYGGVGTMLDIRVRRVSLITIWACGTAP